MHNWQFAKVYSVMYVLSICVTVVEKEEEGAKGSENEIGDQVSEKKETTEGIVLT